MQQTRVAAGRLLRNQEDLGNAIVPFYGKDAGDRLTDLLKQHILIAVNLIEAASRATTMLSLRRMPGGR